MSACSALQAPLEPAGSPLFALASFERMPWVRTPEAPQETRPSCLLGFRLPHCGTGSATPTTVDFGVNYPIHLRSGLRSPCLRFAGVSPHHHARLGTRRLARLYRGSHLRLLNSMRFPRRNPHGPGRAVFPHPVPRLHSLPRRLKPSPVLHLFAVPRREVGSC